MARPLDTYGRVCTHCLVLNTPKRIGHTGEGHRHIEECQTHTGKSARHTPERYVPKIFWGIQSRAGSQEVGAINDNECSVLSAIEAGPKSSLGVKLIYLGTGTSEESRWEGAGPLRLSPSRSLSLSLFLFRFLSFVLSISRSLSRSLARSLSLARSCVASPSLTRSLALSRVKAVLNEMVFRQETQAQNGVCMSKLPVWQNRPMLRSPN